MAALVLSSLCSVAGQEWSSAPPESRTAGVQYSQPPSMAIVSTRPSWRNHSISVNELLTAERLTAVKSTLFSGETATVSSGKPVISTSGTTQLNLITPTRLVLLPTRATRLNAGKSSQGKWSMDRDRTGPYFEDGGGPVNITARAGTDIFLDCHVAMLHNKTVTWTRRRGGRLQLLTVGRAAWAADARVALSFRYPGNWRLALTPVQHGDAGIYECGVATHPPRAKVFNVTVVGPIVQILDESGRAITERYYLAGSEALMACSAVNLSEMPEELVWRREKNNLTREDGVTTSIDLIHRVGRATLALNTNNRTHAGNYTCAAGTATATVYVHILQGVSVLPNTGTSASVRIGLNNTLLSLLIWLIYLALCRSSVIEQLKSES